MFGKEYFFDENYDPRFNLAIISFVGNCLFSQDRLTLERLGPVVGYDLCKAPEIS